MRKAAVAVRVEKSRCTVRLGMPVAGRARRRRGRSAPHRDRGAALAVGVGQKRRAVVLPVPAAPTTQTTRSGATRPRGRASAARPGTRPLTLRIRASSSRPTAGASTSRPASASSTLPLDLRGARAVVNRAGRPGASPGSRSSTPGQPRERVRLVEQVLDGGAVCSEPATARTSSGIANVVCLAVSPPGRTLRGEAAHDRSGDVERPLFRRAARARAGRGRARQRAPATPRAAAADQPSPSPPGSRAPQHGQRQSRCPDCLHVLDQRLPPAWRRHGSTPPGPSSSAIPLAGSVHSRPSRRVSSWRSCASYR